MNADFATCSACGVIRSTADLVDGKCKPEPRDVAPIGMTRCQFWKLQIERERK